MKKGKKCINMMDVKSMEPHFEQILVKVKGDRKNYFLSYEELRKIFNNINLPLSTRKKRTRTWLEVYIGD